MKNAFLLIFCLGLSWNCLGQQVIVLENPSFEGAPVTGIVPDGWINLGVSDASPPDIQPGFFGVAERAEHRQTYVGLVTRDNNTWEGVGQKLSNPMLKDAVYEFSISLNRCNTYRSPTYSNRSVEVSFNSPTMLKIWGYNTKTNQEELLAESQAVGHSNWTRYTFKLSPKLADYDEIDLMAYYAPGYLETNGNLLIDNCSNIELIK